MKVLAAIRDLGFAGKVRAAAQGRRVSFLPDGNELRAQAALERPELILIDLGTAPLGAVAALRTLRSDSSTSHVRVIGYGDHLDPDLVTKAGDLHVEQVMSKREFARKLPALLAR